MLNTFFTVVFLVIILTTVYTNNLTTQLSEAELKKVTEELSNENDSALNKIKTGKIIIPNVCAHRRLHNILTNETKLICYNAYVDPEVGKMWRQFLKEKNYWLKHNLKWTIPMRKDEAVTERMKPFREKHNETNVDKETASSINDATLQTEIFGIKNNNVLSNTSANEYQDVHLSRIERDNIMFLLAQIRNNSNIIKEIGLKYTEMLELAKFMNGNYSFFNETGQKNISRRQLTKQGKLMEKMAQLKGIGQLKNERYREPYWKSGEYVFLRTGSPSTRSSKPTKKKDEKGNVKKDFMEELNETTTQNPMEVFRDCDRTCNYYFKTYGEVCGHRYNTKLWKNQYQTFDNLCDMDHANCVNATINWHPMYKGPCGELGPYHLPPTELNDDAEIKEMLERVNKYGYYSYTPPPITDPTADPIEAELQKELAKAKADAEKEKAKAKADAEMAMGKG